MYLTVLQISCFYVYNGICFYKDMPIVRLLIYKYINNLIEIFRASKVLLLKLWFLVLPTF